MKKTSPELLKYMIDGIKFVCQKYKRRSPGSQSERDAQDYFKKELSEFADEVYSEDFTLHPHAFMGFIFYSAIFSLIGCCMLLAQPCELCVARCGNSAYPSCCSYVPF